MLTNPFTQCGGMCVCVVCVCFASPFCYIPVMQCCVHLPACGLVCTICVRFVLVCVPYILDSSCSPIVSCGAFSFVRSLLVFAAEAAGAFDCGSALLYTTHMFSQAFSFIPPGLCCAAMPAGLGLAFGRGVIGLQCCSCSSTMFAFCKVKGGCATSSRSAVCGVYCRCVVACGVSIRCALSIGLAAVEAPLCFDTHTLMGCMRHSGL